MPLYKRPDSDDWWIDIRHDGKRIRRTTGTANKAAAQEYYDRVKAQLWRQAKLQELPQKTWNDAVKRWVLENAGLKSLQDRKDHLLWATQFLKDKKLTAITRDTLEDLIEKKLAEPVKRGIGVNGYSYVPDPKKTVSMSTVNRYMSSVRRVLYAAKEWGWIETVPTLRTLEEPEGIVRYLMREEVVQLIAELPVHMAEAATLSLLIGQRASNVLLLPWKQVDLARGAAWVVADDAKAGEAIAVPLNAEAVALLRDRREEQARYEQWIIKKHPGRLVAVKAAHRHVFTYQGKALSGKASTAAWYKALKRAKIREFRWHDWRHTWASWHRMAGTPTDALQKLGGWKGAEMVERYAHMSPGYLAQFAANFKPYDGHEGAADDPGQAAAGGEA